MPRPTIPTIPLSVERLRKTVDIINTATDASFITRKLKNVDGIDELAAGLSQIAGILGKIFPFILFTGGTPVVFLGALGMTEEYIEAWDKYKAIIESQGEAFDKIVELTKFSNHWRNYINQKFALGLPTSSLPELKDNVDIETLATQLQQWQAAKDQEFVAALGKRWGWTGASAMTGMFAAMLPNIATYAMQLASSNAPTYESMAEIAKTGSATAIAGLGAAGSFAFAAAQPLMACYGMNRARQGYDIERLLNQQKERIHHLTGANDRTRDAVVEIIDKELFFNYKNYIEYGKVTAAGQSSMFIGSMLGLTGFGGAAGVAFASAGAASTLYAAGSRSLHEGREEHYVSTPSAYTESEYATIDLATNINNKNYLIVNDGYINKADAAFEKYSQKLAEIKFYSIINHLINDRALSSKRKYHTLPGNSHSYQHCSFEDKKQNLENIINYQGTTHEGRLSWRKGTGLQGDIFKRMRAIYDNLDTGTLEVLLGSSLIDANKALLEHIKHCAGNNDITALQRSLAPLDAHSPTDEEEPLLHAAHATHKKPLLQDNDTDRAKLNATLISGLKQSFKFLRYSMAGTLVTAAHCQQIQAQMRADQKRENVTSPPVSAPYEYKKSTSARSFSPTTTSPLWYEEKPAQAKESSITHYNYQALKQALQQTANAQHQHDQLSHYHKCAIHFSKAHEYQENGNTIKIWQDPEHLGQSDYQVTYITNNNTRQTTVKYGRYASAIVTAKGDPSQNIGVRVMEIDQGYHRSFGDTRNTTLNIAESGPNIHSFSSQVKATRTALPSQNSQHSFTAMLNRAASSMQSMFAWHR